jgi:hypothetical protein
MILADPGPLLTPPPSSSPPKTLHLSYSAQTRSQDEEKNPPPKLYLPPQTRTRHRRALRPHVPMLMRGNTPPTTRSPPHRSRLTGNPPNLQPVTVCEEERGGRDPTSRRTPMRAAPDCRPPPTARHASQPAAPAPATLPSNKTQSTGSCAQARGRGQSRSRTDAPRHTAGCGPRPRRRPPRRRSPTRHVPRQQQQTGGNEDILSSATGPSTA